MPQPKLPEQQLHSLLTFNPKDWVSDPAPPWLFQILERDHLVELANASLDLQVNVLRAQLEAAERVQQILRKG
jgi:hypothetical protein